MENRDDRGRFIKGVSSSPGTQFKKGEHWRKKKPFWDREWLLEEYVTKGRSAADIASDFGITENAILFWINKHGIPTREMSQIRKIKKWGLSGDKNPMYGKRGAEVSSWKGGVTAERQAFYSSLEWKEALRRVWKRDAGICARCGTRKEKVHIHHVVSFSVRELRADPENLITLCVDCHKWVHSLKNKNKDFIKEGG